MSNIRCELVTTKHGSRFARILETERVFFNHADDDGVPKGWEETQISWEALSRRMLYVTSHKTDEPLPRDLAEII